MTILRTYATGVNLFNIPLDTGTATATINGVAATVTLVGSDKLSLSPTPAAGDVIEITYTPMTFPVPGNISTPKILRRERGNVGMELWDLYNHGTANRGLPAGGYTYHEVTTVEAPVNAMQLILLNFNSVANKIRAAAVAPATSIADATARKNTDQGAGAWRACLVGGALGTVTPWSVPVVGTVAQSIGGLPAGAAGVTIPGMIITDKVECRSLAPVNLTNNPLGKHIIMYRIVRDATETNYQYKSGGHGLGASPTNWQNAFGNTYGLYKDSFNQVGDFATSSQASFAGGGGEFPPAVIPVYHYDCRSISMLVPGDSIVEGQSTANGLTGWAQVAAAASSSVACPVTCLNLGWRGMTSAQWALTAKTVIARMVALGAPLPDICVIPGTSANDNLATQANGDLGWYQVVDLMEFCITNKITPVLCTPTPQNSSVAHPNAVDAVLNAIRARVALMGGITVDMYTPIAKATGGFAVGLGNQEDPANEVHPNGAGHAAIALAVKDVVSSIVSTNS